MEETFNPTLEIPYPKIEISNKDIDLGYKLLNVYAGRVSELSAINQYSFQSFYLNKYKDLSNILMEISEVEMHHLKILADLICALGLIPYYVTYNCSYEAIPWNADYVDYTTDYRNMLLANINSEVTAIKDYNKLIYETNDPNIKEILNRIIMDEERHIEIFSELLKQYDTP